MEIPTGEASLGQVPKGIPETSECDQLTHQNQGRGLEPREARIHCPHCRSSETLAGCWSLLSGQDGAQGDPAGSSPVLATSLSPRPQNSGQGQYDSPRSQKQTDWQSGRCLHGGHPAPCRQSHGETLLPLGGVQGGGRKERRQPHLPPGELRTHPILTLTRGRYLGLLSAGIHMLGKYLESSGPPALPLLLGSALIWPCGSAFFGALWPLPPPGRKPSRQGG